MMVSGSLYLRITILGGAILILCLITLGGIGSSKTIIVDDSNSQDYYFIQDAIDASEDGDTIRVYEGQYREDIHVSKSVSLIGNGSEQCVIEGIGNSITISAPWVNISGFSISKLFQNNIGIYVLSDDVRIFDSVIKNHHTGIRLSEVSNLNMTNNTIGPNRYQGLHIDRINGSRIEFNAFFEQGITFGGSVNTTIRNNTMNGKPLVFLQNKSDVVVPEGSGQIILDGCNRISITDQNISNTDIGIQLIDSSDCTIEDCKISLESYYTRGISLTFSSDGNHIEDNSISISSYGYAIFLDESSNAVISRNSIKNGDNGILVRDRSNDAYIHNNTIMDSRYGIQIGFSGAVSSNSIIEHNWIENVSDAIIVDRGCHISSIQYNTIVTVRDTAISLTAESHIPFSQNIIRGSESGIILESCDMITLLGNTIEGCEIGITLEDCSNFSISENVITECDIGIYMNSCDLMTIWDNNISVSGDYGMMVHKAKGMQVFDIYDNSIKGANFSAIYSGEVGHMNIWNNVISDSHYGVNIQQSPNAIVSENTLFKCYFGMVLGYISDNSRIMRNDIHSNEKGGVKMYNADLYDIYNNSIRDNGEFGIYIGGSNTCTFIGNVISGNNNSGIYLDYSRNDVFQNNLIEHNTIGINATRSLFQNTFQNNTIRNNSEYGVLSTQHRIDVEYNWWLDETGPYEPEKNPEGKGDRVEKVDFDPWMGKIEPPTARILSIEPAIAVIGQDVSFQGSGSDDLDKIVRYRWHSSLIGEFHNGTESEISLNDLPLGTHTISFSVQDEGGLWSVGVTDALIIHGRPSVTVQSISPNPGVVQESIEFIGIGVDDGSIERYSWRDNSSEFYNGTEEKFNIRRPLVGNYSIFLKVMDNYGAWSDEVQQELIITQRPNATIIDISPNPSVSGQSILFQGKGIDDGTVVLYRWRSGTTILYDGPDPEFTLANISPGVHTINLKVLDNLGFWSGEDSITLEIQRDSDGDGIGEDEDAFPKDPAASVDDDGDGYPDSWNPEKSKSDSTTGLELDQYPDEPLKWRDEEEKDGVIPGFGLIVCIISICIVFQFRKWMPKIGNFQ